MCIRDRVEAPRNDYGGDDWGIADEYNEYGTYDDNDEAPQAAVPQPATGFRHHGQSASIGSVKGRASYEAPNAQPTLPSLQRTNSFDMGDEGQTFSALNSPAVTQGQTAATLPPGPEPHIQQVRTQPEHVQQDYSSESYHSAQSRRPSIPSTTSSAIQPQPPGPFLQHISPRFHFQHTEPSHEPEYDDRDYSDHGGQAGLGLIHNADEGESQRHSFLPPLRSEIEEDPYHYPMASSHHHRLPPFPPRKSSLTTRSRPDLNELYQAHQDSSNGPLPDPKHSTYSSSFGAPTQRQDVTTPEEEVPQAGPKFIRPADIYKRMAEEKEKERRSSDASRQSPERPEANVMPQARKHDNLLQEQSRAVQDHSSSYLSSTAPPVHDGTSRVSPSNETANLLSPKSPEIPLAPASEDPPYHPVVPASIEQSHNSMPSLLGFTISNPILARALGASAQEDAQPAQISLASDPSPILPSIGRFSGFGSLADGIWQNQFASDGIETARQESGRQSLDKGTTPSQSPGIAQPLSFKLDTGRTQPAAERDWVARQSLPHPHDQLDVPANHSASVNPLVQDDTYSESPLGSPTDYYFSDQAGSMGDRMYSGPGNETNIRSPNVHASGTTEEVSATNQRLPTSLHGRDMRLASSVSNVHSRQPSAAPSLPANLPEPAQAISRAELNRDETTVPRTSLEEQKVNYPTDSFRSSLNEYDKTSKDNSRLGDLVQHTESTRAELGAPTTLPQPIQAISRHELDADSAADHEDSFAKPQQNDDKPRGNTSALKPLNIATFPNADDATLRHDSILKNPDRVTSMRNEQEDDYSPSIYTPLSARPGMETREADHAAALSARSEERYLDAQSARISQNNLSSLRQLPTPIQSRFLQEPQSDPITRATSPGGRVKQLADKFDEIHTLSRQSTMQSPTGSASGRRERGGHDSDDVGNTSSLRSNQSYERPRLPGEWISYADTVESADHSDNDRDRTEEDDEYVDDLGQIRDEDELPTPTAERPESPIDFSPTTKKRSLYGATNSEEPDGPMAALAAAGHALASSLQSIVGMKTDDDDRKDTDSDATESLLPTPDVETNISERTFGGFQHQPSSPARDAPISVIEEPVIEHARQPPNNESETRDVEEDVETSDIANFDRVIPVMETSTLSAEHESDREDDIVSVDSDIDVEPVASPAPLRPHSHVPRTTVESVPQRPIWPSQASAMSVNYSPEDTESDQLRKDIIRSLSPNPESSRRSLDVESNPRSSTEYPQFNVNPDTTPERKLPSAPLHLSTPAALATGEHSNEHIDHSTGSPLKADLLTVQPPQPTAITRESTLLPQIYDSYWVDRDSQDDDHQYDRDASDRPISQTISALSSVREDRTPDLAATTQTGHDLRDENDKLRHDTSSRPNYLAQRFSWERQEQSTPSPAEPASQPLHHTEVIGAKAHDLSEVNEPRSHAATKDIDQSTSTTDLVPGNDRPHKLGEPLADLPLAKSSALANQASRSSDSFSQPIDTSINTPRGPSEDLSSVSPAQYKYERPFQRTPSESAGTHTGLRKTSTTALHPHLSERNRTISSGQFSIPGETSLSGFKTIASIRATPDRITAFEKTREGFANLDTGLNQWLAYMFRANPELLDDESTPIKRTATTGFAGSMRHKLAPSISKLTRTNDNASTLSIPESSAPSMSARSPSMTRRTPSTSETGSSKGKAFLQNAGQGAKGFFAKSKSKMRGASGQQKVE